MLENKIYILSRDERSISPIDRDPSLLSIKQPNYVSNSNILAGILDSCLNMEVTQGDADHAYLAQSMDRNVLLYNSGIERQIEGSYNTWPYYSGDGTAIYSVPRKKSKFSHKVKKSGCLVLQ